ncbi:IS66 family insertion sequence element accessory protein TnpB [Bradyrhizobium sp. CB82]|uniref:IS66 family insertion sequence element accessory protein TnpB n=1 Tax=Bradyrhizobium sp. CB82 TaxID=3039159 RepID=UPI0032C2218C
MRKGFASLSLQVQEVLRRDPLSGHLFCFRERRGDLLKVIWHDGQGACLFAKKLERGRLCLAVAGGRRGVDLAGADELSVVRHRLAQSPRVLASDQWAETLLFELGRECDSIWLWTPAPTCGLILPPRIQ